MTVKWLMHWQTNHGAPLNSQILTEACQCVEGLNGVKSGRWKSLLTFYRPVIRDTSSSLGGVEHPKDFVGLVLQEQPDKYYFILRAHQIVLESDTSIQSVMEKSQSYKARIVLNFEGFQYKLGDFQLRVGKCVPLMSESLRGIMMEVVLLTSPEIICMWDCYRTSSFFREKIIIYMHSEPEESCSMISVDINHTYEVWAWLLRCSWKSKISNCAGFEGRVPLSSIEKSRLVLEEFFDIWQEAISKMSLPGHFMHIESNFAEYDLSDHYTSQHTAVQYAPAWPS